MANSKVAKISDALDLVPVSKGELVEHTTRSCNVYLQALRCMLPSKRFTDTLAPSAYSQAGDW